MDKLYYKPEIHGGDVDLFSIGVSPDPFKFLPLHQVVLESVTLHHVLVVLGNQQWVLFHEHKTPPLYRLQVPCRADDVPVKIYG